MNNYKGQNIGGICFSMPGKTANRPVKEAMVQKVLVQKFKYIFLASKVFQYDLMATVINFFDFLYHFVTKLSFGHDGYGYPGAIQMGYKPFL